MFWKNNFTISKSNKDYKTTTQYMGDILCKAGSPWPEQLTYLHKIRVEIYTHIALIKYTRKRL